jgi:hypothetical protein
MATYKKGYKKQSSDQVLLKVIVGIIISVVVLVGVVFIYDASTKWKEYDNYTHVTEYADIFDLTDGDGNELNDYVVYLYDGSGSCENCNAAKNDMLKYGSRLDDNQFFLADINDMTDDDTALDDFLAELDRTDLVYPLLVIVIDGEYYDYVSGYPYVVNSIQSIQEGDYEVEFGN